VGLKVIGSGLGRTGTMSMQKAMNLLGLGPCHHMLEVFGHPESVPLWIAAGDGRPDWDALFADYRSVMDYPGATHWRALAAYYPEAKIVHTVRDPDAWFESTQATIFEPRTMETMLAGPFAPFARSFLGEAADRLGDRAYMIDYFNRHTREVIAGAAPERLLVYRVGEGWEPLCEFLGVPIPDTPFPSENDRAAFHARSVAGGRSS